MRVSRHRAVLDANDPRALAAVLRSSGEVTVSEETLRANEVPAPALMGERDMYRPLADSLVAVKTNTELEVLPGASHITALQDPGFTRAILDFLRAYAEEGGE